MPGGWQLSLRLAPRVYGVDVAVGPRLAYALFQLVDHTFGNDRGLLSSRLLAYVDIQ